MRPIAAAVEPLADFPVATPLRLVDLGRPRRAVPPAPLSSFCLMFDTKGGVIFAPICSLSVFAASVGPTDGLALINSRIISDLLIFRLAMFDPGDAVSEGMK